MFLIILSRPRVLWLQSSVRCGERRPSLLIQHWALHADAPPEVRITSGRPMIMCTLGLEGSGVGLEVFLVGSPGKELLPAQTYDLPCTALKSFQPLTAFQIWNLIDSAGTLSFWPWVGRIHSLYQAE